MSRSPHCVIVPSRLITTLLRNSGSSPLKSHKPQLSLLVGDCVGGGSVGDVVGGGFVGLDEGDREGVLEGCRVGFMEGLDEGSRDGDTEGQVLGCWDTVGVAVGQSEGIVELLGEKVSVGNHVMFVILVMLLGDQVMFPVGYMVSLGYIVAKSALS